MRVERRSDIELPGGREREGAGSEQEVGEEGKEGKEGKWRGAGLGRGGKAEKGGADLLDIEGTWPCNSWCVFFTTSHSSST